MENFYKKIRARSDEKPRLMTIIVALFYFLIGMGFTGIKLESNITMFISCILCLYMASLVYAIVKGNIVKAILNCTLFFAFGALFKYMAVMSVLTLLDLGFAFVMFVVFFGVGLLMGHFWYGRYIDK